MVSHKRFGTGTQGKRGLLYGAGRLKITAASVAHPGSLTGGVRRDLFFWLDEQVDQPGREEIEGVVALSIRGASSSLTSTLSLDCGVIASRVSHSVMKLGQINATNLILKSVRTLNGSSFLKAIISTKTDDTNN